MRTIPLYGDDPGHMGRTIAWLLRDDRPQNLRAISFSFKPADMPRRGHVVLRAHFFKLPDEATLELIKDLEAELYAQTPDEFDYSVEAQTTPIGTRMDLLPHIAWIDEAEAYRRR